MFETLKQKMGSLFKKETEEEADESLSFTVPLTPALRRRMKEEEQFEKYGVIKEKFWTESTLD